MTLIAIETSTDSCSLSLFEDGQPVLSLIENAAANHARQLPVFAEQCLALVRAKQMRVDAVAVSMGPGSYTGLRIGVSVAKGICYGLSVPLIAVDTLQVLAAEWRNRCEDISQNALICPMIDARRMEVFTAMYDSGTLERIGDVMALVVDENSLKNELKEKDIYFVGNGAAKCSRVMQHQHAHFASEIVCPKAEWVAKVVESGMGIRMDEKQMAYFEPFYLKEFVPAPSHVKGLE